MKPVYVSTSNTKRFLGGISGLERRGAAEACLMVLDGEPGLGKTRTAQWWAVQNGAVYLRAKQEWTPTWCMREILSFLNRRPEYSFEKNYQLVSQVLEDMAITALREKKPFGVVVDEVDYISRQQRLLETLRDLSDELEIPFILVGMGRVRHNLTRFPQVASRVAQHVEFKPESIDDAAKLFKGLCEVEVKPDLVEFVHKAAKGRFREIKEAIAAIERIGQRQGKPMGLAELDGQVLFQDRGTGQPVVARV